MSTATAAVQTYSLTDTIWLLDLQREYGEVRGLELYFERTSEIELERIRSGSPLASSYRDETGRIRGALELDQLGDRLEERLRSLKPGWLTRTIKPRGETRVSPSRPIYRGGVRPAVPAKRLIYEIDLRESRSTKMIEISGYALDEIHQECQRHGWEVESGGGLYSFRDRSRSWSRTLRISDADVAVVERSYGAVTLDGAGIRAERDRLTRRWGGEEQLVIGCWHSHPQRSKEPSETDLEGWGRGLVKHDAGVYVGLIATAPAPHLESWRKPVLSAWVLRHDEYRREMLICEPADVVFR